MTRAIDLAGQNYQALAEPLIEMGYDRVIPLKPRSKAPRYPAWEAANSAPIPPKILAGWIAAGARDGVGLAAGAAVAGLDLDHKVPELAAAVRGLADEIVGQTPIVRVGNWPKTLRLYRQSTVDPVITRTYRGIDLGTYGTTGQVALFAIHPETGRPYSYPEEAPLDVPANELPEISDAKVQALALEMRQIIAPRHIEHSGAGQTGVMATAGEYWQSVRHDGVDIGTAMARYMAGLTGQYHPAMTGAVALLASCGWDEQEIVDAIAEPYLRHFVHVGQREVVSRYRKLIASIRGAHKRGIGQDPVAVLAASGFANWGARRY